MTLFLPFDIMEHFPTRHYINIVCASCLLSLVCNNKHLLNQKYVCNVPNIVIPCCPHSEIKYFLSIIDRGYAVLTDILYFLYMACSRTRQNFKSLPHPPQISPLSDAFFSIKPSTLLRKSSASIYRTLFQVC